MDKLSNKKVALVYDWVDKWGGAERVLLTLHEMFPDAPLYTAVYNANNAPWAKVFPKIIAPKIKFKHEWFPWLIPMIFETYNFDQYDLVISVSSFAAKGIITKPHTTHINYCLTPTRFLWSHSSLYGADNFGPFFEYLKSWDRVASNRPDKIIAISKTVQERISNFYQKDSDVVYPPVNTGFFVPDTNPQTDYFLVVGRMESYKNGKKIIEIFNTQNIPLVVVGTGSIESELKSIAGPNITFAGQISDEKLLRYYQNCKALIFWHEEDFGIIPVEVMSCGKPVIGLDRGGVSETVIDRKTGVLVNDEINNLISAILSFDLHKFDSDIIRKRALEFSKAKFIAKLNRLCRTVT
jgi:glycosyltransferase involved in cell wall biosynthesis